MKEVVIASIVRTPIGSFGGGLKGVSAVELGVAAAEEAIKRAGISKDIIDELIFGNVLQAGLSQNTARQVAIKAGMPESMPSYTVNKLCGSGLKAIALAAQSIIAGDNEIVVAGGTESMSNAPYLLQDARWGLRMGDSQVVDSMVLDGLTDAFHKYHMGITAENIAEEQGISREEQDEFAAQSQNRAEAAIKSGRFKDEIVPITIPQRKGDPLIFDTDEFPRFGLTAEKLSGLRTAFKKEGGTVTAGNASGVNDGAAACVVMSKEKADELGIKPLATIVAYASAGVAPKTMGYGPIASTQAVLKKSGINLSDIELIEANEAFAVQSLAVCKGLNLDKSIVNVNGGAIALGHPIGASGARILTTLIYEMKKRGNKMGLATLCIGGGQGISMIVKM